MSHCEGWVRASGRAKDMRLRPCQVEVRADERFCSYHAKVAAGLIKDAAWQPDTSHLPPPGPVRHPRSINLDADV